jgi:hypothetical protein
MRDPVRSAPPEPGVQGEQDQLHRDQRDQRVGGTL